MVRLTDQQKSAIMLEVGVDYQSRGEVVEAGQPGTVDDGSGEVAMWKEYRRRVAEAEAAEDTLVEASFAPATEAQRVAYAICRAAHAGQVDKQQVAYHLHPEAVAVAAAASVTGSDPVFGDAVVVTALLHDVVEDSPMTPEDLDEAGLGTMPLGGEIIAAIGLLTRDPSDTYGAFIEKVATAEGTAGEIARIVKLADVTHNVGRFTPEIEMQLGVRYAAASDRLHRALREHRCGSANSNQDR